jgi:hypothetical protein
MAKRIGIAFLTSVIQVAVFGLVFLLSWRLGNGIGGSTIPDALIFWLFFRFTYILVGVGVTFTNLIDALVNIKAIMWILVFLLTACYIGYWVIALSHIRDSAAFFLYPGLAAILFKIPFDILLRKMKRAKAIA